MQSISRATAVLFLIFAAILWSTGGLLIKWVTWHPIAIAGIRSGISSLVMLTYFLLRYKQPLKKPDKYVVFAALNYAILVMLFVAANKLTTSANAILLQFTAPAWVLVFGVLFFKERFSKKDIVVVGVVFIGMLLFFIGDIDGGGLLGNVLAVFSGISMALMIISLKKVSRHKPMEIIIWGNIFTFLLAIPFYGNLDFTGSNLTGIFLLGIFQLGLSYIFFTTAISHVTALEGILIPVIEPLLNPIWVLLGTGEQPTIYAILGGVIVLAAVLYHSLHKVGDTT